MFDTLRPDLIDVRSEANPTGENIAVGQERGEGGVSTGSTKRRTTSGKEVQEVRAAARAAMENGAISSPGHSREKEVLPETSKGSQRGNADGQDGKRLLPRDELIAYLQRGLLWQEAVQHASGNVSFLIDNPRSFGMAHGDFFPRNPRSKKIALRNSDY